MKIKALDLLVYGDAEMRQLCYSGPGMTAGTCETLIMITATTFSFHNIIASMDIVIRMDLLNEKVSECQSPFNIYLFI